MDQIAQEYLKLTLRSAKKGQRPEMDMGEDYRKALETLGFVKFGWDVELTSLGKDLLGMLEAKDDDWGS